VSTMLAPAAPTAFGTDVMRHLDAQLASARRLLDAVLRQGAAIRNRDVDSVLARLGEMQAEMERRSTLERDRVRLVRRDQLLDLRVDVGQAPLAREVGGGLDHAAVERSEAPVATRHDAVAGVREAWIDAKDDHAP